MSTSFCTSDIDRAVAAVQRNDVVGLPTETVYGLAGNALCPEVVQKIFRLKGRPPTNPLILHVAHLNQVLPYTSANQEQLQILHKLAAHFWPGPLTIVLPASSVVDPAITAQSGWVGFRMPSHPVALELLQRCSVPLAAPSANRSGHISPTTALHVVTEFSDSDLLVLDGGACEIGLESTVVKVVSDREIHILRAGCVGAEDLQNACGARVIQRGFSVIGTEVTSQSPGQHLVHYSPGCPCFLLENQEMNLHLLRQFESRFLIDWNGLFLKYSDDLKCYFDLNAENAPFVAAQKFFNVLRDFESKALIEKNSAIFLVTPTTISNAIHCALLDRMYRAAGGKFLKY